MAASSSIPDVSVPAPSRTISASRSTTRKPPDGCTSTMTMWMELLPRSMAAIFMTGENCMLDYAFLRKAKEPIMIPGPENAKNPVTLFLREKSRHLFRNLPLAMAGQEEPVHQIRVAARRLRATLPIAAHGPPGGAGSDARSAASGN